MCFEVSVKLSKCFFHLFTRYSMKVVKAAAQVLSTLWQYRDLRTIYKKARTLMTVAMTHDHIPMFLHVFNILKKKHILQIPKFHKVKTCFFNSMCCNIPPATTGRAFFKDTTPGFF